MRDSCQDSLSLVLTFHPGYTNQASLCDSHVNEMKLGISQ